MSHMRFRTNIPPIRRSSESRIGHHRRPLPGVTETVLAERPAVPMHCLRPTVLKDSAERFLSLFPGQVLYAVKCNPEPAVLRALWAGGVRHFDCASAGEVRLVRQMFPDARIHFMHPVKSRPAIREAWEWHGVRDFVIDSAAELTKILEETSGAYADLGLVVRLSLPKGGAVYDLSGKFGAEPTEAVRLLKLARTVADRVG
ncbi:MAG TPA: type III PLP-dependent enzyme, partial [Magnetospirillum sp.]|nr:type III PLP-dependent enzyme [Magnetospirillum sp.]